MQVFEINTDSRTHSHWLLTALHEELGIDHPLAQAEYYKRAEEAAVMLTMKQTVSINPLPPQDTNRIAK